MTTPLSLYLNSQDLLSPLLNPNYGRQTPPTLDDTLLNSIRQGNATADALGRPTTTDNSPLTDLASKAALGEQPLTASEQQAAGEQNINEVRRLILDIMA